MARKRAWCGAALLLAALLAGVAVVGASGLQQSVLTKFWAKAPQRAPQPQAPPHAGSFSP